jgi:hypothetical protein
MKTFNRASSLVLILVFVLLAVPVSAQEVEELSGVLVIYADTGSLVAGEGDAYTLTLEGIEDAADWLLVSPDPAVSHVDILSLVGNWTAVEGLEATGLTEAGDISLTLTLSAPEYDADAETLSFAAMVEEAVMAEEPKSGPEIPEAFEDVSLFILSDTEFTAGWLAGLEGSRDFGPEICSRPYIQMIGEARYCAYNNLPSDCLPCDW